MMAERDRSRGRVGRKDEAVWVTTFERKRTDGDPAKDEALARSNRCFRWRVVPRKTRMESRTVGNPSLDRPSSLRRRRRNHRRPEEAYRDGRNPSRHWRGRRYRDYEATNREGRMAKKRMAMGDWKRLNIQGFSDEGILEIKGQGQKSGNQQICESSNHI